MILAAGEALVDMLPALLADGTAGFRAVPGGAALNLARAVAGLGTAAALFCPLSTDPWGGMLRAAAAGVDLALCPEVDRPTTLAVVTLRDGQPAFAFHDEGSAMRGLTAADLPALPEAVRAVVVGGVSLVPDPCGAAFAALAAREAGCVSGRRAVVLDANIRPACIRDADAHRARLRRIMAGAALVKLSDEDAAWLYGPGSPEGWAAAARADGAGMVAVTLGAGGAVLVAPGATVVQAAPAVTLADTVGAGDAFLAALLDGLLRRGGATEALAAALAEGVAAGALACTRPGAQAPGRDAVLRLAAQLS
jgi:fructokinase